MQILNRFQLVDKYSSVVAAPNAVALAEGYNRFALRRMSTIEPVPAVVEAGWGWFPMLSFVSACGLFSLALGNNLALAAVGWAEPLFWLGLLVMLVPVIMRVLMVEPTRRERISLIVWLGLGFYLVKFLHSPFAFTFSDEYLHYYNTLAILQNQTIFTPNPILQVSSYYPGLPLITAALSGIGNLPIFYAGLLVIGAARLVLYLGMFHLMEAVSGSTRLAGVATVLYMCHSNFLFWSAQFSYESLSLPLAVGVLYLAVSRQQIKHSHQTVARTLLAYLGISAIALIHHLTSYFVALFFIVWWLTARLRLHVLFVSLISRLFRTHTQSETEVQVVTTPATAKRTVPVPNADAHDVEILSDRDLGRLALFAVVVALAWLTFAANRTINYLSPVLFNAVLSIVQMVIGEGTSRQLFVSTAGNVAPLWERVSGLGSVLLCLVGLPFGLWQVWRCHRYNVLALLLSATAVAYFGMLGFRFTSAGWETGNRAAAYLFIGLVYVLAVGIVEFWLPRRVNVPSALLVGAYVAVIFVGGIVSGWPPALRLTQPYLIEVAGRRFEPQGVTAARWMLHTFGPGNRVVVDESNGRFMLAYGEQYSFAGRQPNTKELLLEPDLPAWQLAAIEAEQLRFMIMDRRPVSWDNMLGYYFDRLPPPREDGQADEEDLASDGRALQNAADAPPPEDDRWFSQEVTEKYDRQAQVDRIWDSGNLVIYDIKAMRK